jgi:DNA-binding beta-propeller fold protein YncE
LCGVINCVAQIAETGAIFVTDFPQDRVPGRNALSKRVRTKASPALFLLVSGLVLIAPLVALRSTGARASAVSAVPGAPSQDYLVYVVCESADKVVLLRFGPRGFKIERETHIGLLPMGDINGPHGIAVSPDKEYVYVSLGHGQPNGSAWKLKAGTDEVVRYVPLGLFPATMDITKDGEFIYVANANFHGDMVPSSISVVATGEMAEVKRITTCTMPHGSRLNPQGTKHYSACMMDDMLTEIDTHKFDVSRRFLLTKDKEGSITGAPHEAFSGTPHAQAQSSEHDPAMTKDFHRGPTNGQTNVNGQMNMAGLTCVPTWAQPSNDGAEVFIACNKSNDIAVVDVASWKLARRFTAGNGVYNLAITKDGRLIATNKRGQSVSIFDSKMGNEVAHLATKRKVVHGAVVTPDNRYAFISVEGIGNDPGTVEVIDLGSMTTVATLDVPQQAAGIDFWKTEPTVKLLQSYK